jgi:hypothetical protein
MTFAPLPVDSLEQETLSQLGKVGEQNETMEERSPWLYLIVSPGRL